VMGGAALALVLALIFSAGCSSKDPTDEHV